MRHFTNYDITFAEKYTLHFLKRVDLNIEIWKQKQLLATKVILSHFSLNAPILTTDNFRELKNIKLEKCLELMTNPQPPAKTTFVAICNTLEFRVKIAINMLNQAKSGMVL